jgi:hypothetical protein
MPEIARHKIYIEGRWELHDLYLFPQRYGEIYSFLYALSASGPRGRFVEIFQRYPWRGGYSAVKFYDDLYLSISSDQRPRIASIEYGSPGYIELSAVLLIVTQIDRILNGVMKSWDRVDAIYTKIHKRAMQRRLLKLNVKERERRLSAEEVRFAARACEELSHAIGLGDCGELNRLTRDPLASLKILMAFYRRLSELLSFIDQGKVRIDQADKSRLANKITE